MIEREFESCPDCGRMANKNEYSEVTELECKHCGLALWYDYYDGDVLASVQRPVLDSLISEYMLGG